VIKLFYFITYVTNP